MRVRLSEVMVDPKAVEDAVGEFIEVVNADEVAVNLAGWRLADGGGRSHVIAAELVLQPGEYAVLTRGSAEALAGYVRSDYQYGALQLANSAGMVMLYAPGNETPVDAFAWGEAVGRKVVAGASFERVSPEGSEWSVASRRWSDAHTDRGSPGRATATDTPTPTPTPTETPTVVPETWHPLNEASPLQIDEVHFAGKDQEFIALVNLGAETVSLRGWMISDAETPRDDEGIYSLPDSAELPPGAVYVIARNASVFLGMFGRPPDAAWERSQGDIPLLQRSRHLGRGEMALNDGGDEVVLLAPSGLLADAVAYNRAAYASLSLAGALTADNEQSLQRVPGIHFAAAADLRHRFLAALPQPFISLHPPSVPTRLTVRLDEAHQALWGSLGAASNFSPGFPAPPHYLLMEAAAQGLDFLAIADETPTYPVLLPPEILFLPAWRWKEEKEEIIVYNDAPPTDRSRSGIEAYLNGLNTPWQIVAGVGNFRPAPLVASAASDLPADMKDWFVDWQRNRAPFLPGGNSFPNSPEISRLRPRYTGLAVRSTDASGLHEALLARRGWVTTSPGLWLTLQAETMDGQRIWMGSWLSPANQVMLHIAYGDRSGEVAGLALWQDGQLIHQLDRPAPDGRWTLTIPALPGSILTVVATQFDGDFAVTAPLFIEADATGDLLINEVLPAPRNDYNGDGVVDSNDEYIELYNPSRAPIPLEGWVLTNGDDETAQRMKFGKGRYLGGGERLLLLRRAHRLSLRNDGGVVRLLDPQGVEHDRVEWDATLSRGRSVSRIPDGGPWVWNADATPGRANANTGVDDFAPWPGTPPPSLPATPSKARPPVNPAAEATAGQAGGPPGSIAQAKLMGLEAWVEFRAVVVAPPGLFNSNIYVADLAPDGVTAGIGINVYLRRGEYPPLEAGDWVLLRGRLASFRGETELVLDTPDQIWRIQSGIMPRPLPVRVSEIGESLEGRLVTFRGVVTRWQGDSIYLGDPDDPEAEPVRVTVRSSLGWKRPYVKLNELWEVTGLVSQFARQSPWNGGYRILVRWPSDLVKVAGPR